MTMNSDSPRERPSLDLVTDLLQADSPGLESVLHHLRRAKSRRRARLCLLGGGVTLLFVTALFVGLVQRAPSPGSAGIRAAAPPAPARTSPAVVPIEHVTDEGLLELLPDQPVALVRLPDGRRQLLVLVRGENASEDRIIPKRLP